MAEDKSTLDNNGNDDLNKPFSVENTPSDQLQDLNEPGDITSSDEDIHNSDNSVIEDSDVVSSDNLSVVSEGEGINNTTPVQKEEKASNKSKFNIYKVIRIACIIGFVVFSALFINEVIIQPWRIKQSIDLTRQLYDKPTDAPTAIPSPTLPPNVTVTAAPTPVAAAIPTPDPNRDSLGRLLQFKDLLATNADVKGWLTIPDTNVDYVVVQPNSNNPELYLDKDINLEYSKAGTLFLDYHGSVENNSQNLVIHGHNMVSTAEKMFHYILKYKKVSYYKDHPLITFDTIYNTGKWKVFAVFITNGASKKEPLFDYTKANFKNASDFLNFVYQLRIRSELNIDSVDITDTDQLLMLSTCSYEVDNYRTVIVARKVRDGEDTNVDTSNVSVNDNPLYPESYYYRYGGKAPELPATFEDALANGNIKWYTPPVSNSGQ